MIEKLKMVELRKRFDELKNEKEIRRACDNNFDEFKDV